MPHACQRCWNCHKTPMFCTLLAGCRIPYACNTKRRFNVKKWREHVVSLAFWLRNVLRATMAYTFERLNFHKCSEAVSFLHRFWLSNVLRARTACIFSTSQLAKVLQRCGIFSILTSKFASRHNGVQFFISHLARWLRTRCFSLRFEPPEPQNIGKTRYFGTFLPFRAPASSFFWRFLFSDLSSSLLWLFPPLLFHLSILSEVWLLNFLRLVGLRVNMFGRRISELAATGVEESSRFQLAKRLKHSCENLWNLKLAKLLLFFITFILFEVSAGSLGFCCIGFQLRW